ncbi:MAG: uncharacterized protein A8A55_0357 [Amphiamblys sp. WSBS2006]|nr:MAG: uncharacterized protein A8A55_0357 [Amphiamblys sp. WSBS2006]
MGQGGREVFREHFMFFLENAEDIKETECVAQSFLIHGQSGSGKKTVVERLCAENSVDLVRIDTLCEATSRQCLEKTHSPFCVLLMEGVDVLLGDRDMEAPEVFLVWLVHEIRKRRPSSVFLLAATATTTLGDSVSQKRIFDRRIEMERPSAAEREAILRELVSGGVDFASVAKKTVGFLPTDLLHLCALAEDGARGTGPTTAEIESQIEHVEVGRGRDNRVAVEDGCTWSDIAGMDSLIRDVRRYIEYPLLHRDLLHGIPKPKGVLLHGPPGTSKTTIARILSSTCSARFFSIDGASLYSCYSGESERILRDLFSSARAVSPSIVFLDEIDSIVGKRGAKEDSGVRERILATLLNEMDGVVELQDVVVLAATNRLDRIDEALLRPGRFDKILRVDYPDGRGRQAIFELCLGRIEQKSEIDCAALSSMTGEISGAEIKDVCQEAGYRVFCAGRDTLTQEDIVAVLREKEYFTKAMPASWKTQ